MVPLIGTPLNWAKLFHVLWGRIKRGPLYWDHFHSIQFINNTSKFDMQNVHVHPATVFITNGEIQKLVCCHVCFLTHIVLFFSTSRYKGHTVIWWTDEEKHTDIQTRTFTVNCQGSGMLTCSYMFAPCQGNVIIYVKRADIQIKPKYHKKPEFHWSVKQNYKRFSHNRNV